MSFTVVPLHNLSLPAGTQIPFGSGFILEDVPEWVTKDSLLNELSRHDRLSASEAKHALVAEYEAAAIGEPDPEWRGKTPKSIQDVKFDSVTLANIALWLVQPSAVCFTVGFHAIALSFPGEQEKRPIILQMPRQSPLHCHPKDLGNVVSVSHAAKAGRLHAVLSSIPRNNPVWEAMRALWAALTMYSADRRYPFFWMGLESLFGSDDSGEISYKLCQRVAFFLADDPEAGRTLFRKARNCYNMRSKIIHGRWKNDPKLDSVMADTEAMVRTVLRNLSEDPEMLRTFISNQRDKFLEDWVFSRSTEPPPFPR